MNTVTAEVHEVLVHTMLFKMVIYSEIIQYIKYSR